MTTYQDLFNNMDPTTIDPSTISQQDALATLFPGIPSLNSNMIDDWLADELCKSGLIANSLDFLSGSDKQQQDILAMLPYSPPFSPTTSIATSDSPKTPCTVPLFPDIATVKPAATVAILPKVANILPRIAPRPTTAPVMVKEEPAPILKRRLTEVSPVVDQDEIALKRQKNTDAARRSRLKKLVKMEHLEERVADLEADNHRLNTRIAVLESEKAGLESKDISMEDRIRVLEAQLAEAHKALTKV
ncbi:hypothetical protein INT47_004397 [Mucor saturninus]|uniref:BZIP domain-containing protein n=1 Tax=Mucor saturninus TaxID=64648 RepID=A0A8H7R1J5_9FUNG|nr:hypothetical protein INT47_004397 [Mucor saturninus]